jgi:mono/diheme cytochrome c family protein
VLFLWYLSCYGSEVKRLVSIRLACSLSLLAAACDQNSTNLRTWRASDHDHEELTNRASAPANDEASGQPSEVQSATALPSATTSPHGQDSPELVAAMQLWAAKCVRCHGQIGAGDGPDGSRVGARNLTDPAWQKTTSDERIAASISSGRGMMPAFTVEAETLSELVRLVRQLGGTRTAQPDGQQKDALSVPASATSTTRTAAAPPSSAVPRAR